MERPPAIAPDLVNEFVRKAHSDLARVKEAPAAFECQLWKVIELPNVAPQHK